MFGSKPIKVNIFSNPSNSNQQKSTQNKMPNKNQSQSNDPQIYINSICMVQSFFAEDLQRLTEDKFPKRLEGVGLFIGKKTVLTSASLLVDQKTGKTSEKVYVNFKKIHQGKQTFQEEILKVNTSRVIQTLSFEQKDLNGPKLAILVLQKDLKDPLKQLYIDWKFNAQKESKLSLLKTEKNLSVNQSQTSVKIIQINNGIITLTIDLQRQSQNKIKGSLILNKGKIVAILTEQLGDGLYQAVLFSYLVQSNQIDERDLQEFQLEDCLTSFALNSTQKMHKERKQALKKIQKQNQTLEKSLIAISTEVTQSLVSKKNIIRRLEEKLSNKSYSQKHKSALIDNLNKKYQKLQKKYEKLLNIVQAHNKTNKIKQEKRKTLQQEIQMLNEDFNEKIQELINENRNDKKIHQQEKNQQRNTQQNQKSDKIQRLKPIQNINKSFQQIKKQAQDYFKEQNALLNQDQAEQNKKQDQPTKANIQIIKPKITSGLFTNMPETAKQNRLSILSQNTKLTENLSQAQILALNETKKAQKPLMAGLFAQTSHFQTKLIENNNSQQLNQQSKIKGLFQKTQQFVPNNSLINKTDKSTSNDISQSKMSLANLFGSNQSSTSPNTVNQPNKINSGGIFGGVSSQSQLNSSPNNSLFNSVGSINCQQNSSFNSMKSSISCNTPLQSPIPINNLNANNKLIFPNNPPTLSKNSLINQSVQQQQKQKISNQKNVQQTYILSKNPKVPSTCRIGQTVSKFAQNKLTKQEARSSYMMTGKQLPQPFKNDPKNQTKKTISTRHGTDTDGGQPLLNQNQNQKTQQSSGIFGFQNKNDLQNSSLQNNSQSGSNKFISQSFSNQNLNNQPIYGNFNGKNQQDTNVFGRKIIQIEKVPTALICSSFIFQNNSSQNQNQSNKSNDGIFSSKKNLQNFNNFERQNSQHIHNSSSPTRKLLDEQRNDLKLKQLSSKDLQNFLIQSQKDNTNQKMIRQVTTETFKVIFSNIVHYNRKNAPKDNRYKFTKNGYVIIFTLPNIINSLFQSLTQPINLKNLLSNINWNHLEAIILPSCKINNQGWKAIIENSHVFLNLQTIDLNHNQIKDIDVDQTGQLKSLKKLILNDNPLTDLSVLILMCETQE